MTSGRFKEDSREREMDETKSVQSIHYVQYRERYVLKKWPAKAKAEIVAAKPWKEASVTRLGDLLDFGQLFKAFCNN